MRMVAAKLIEEPFRCVAFAIIFRLAILLDDRLGHHRNDFFDRRMHNRSTEHLMRISDLAIAMMFFETGITMGITAGKIAGAIQRQQVGSFIKLKRSECFSSLQCTENITKDGAKTSQRQTSKHRRVRF